METCNWRANRGDGGTRGLDLGTIVDDGRTMFLCITKFLLLLSFPNACISTHKEMVNSMPLPQYYFLMILHLKNVKAYNLN